MDGLVLQYQCHYTVTDTVVMSDIYVFS